jgi:uncharacterized repeat protein (TIGR04138 family)
MQEVSFEDALEIITLKDPRYPREAYLFVREALDHTQRLLAKEKQGGIRHVSGQELLRGIKDYAVLQFGPMAMMVLGEWGINACSDFGELVFNMVETGGCPTLSTDDITNLPALIKVLSSKTDPFCSFLWENLPETTRQFLLEDRESVQSRELLTRDLNELITSAELYDEERLSGVTLPGEAKCLASHRLEGVALAQFNRLLVESALPLYIAKSHGLLAKTKNDSRSDFEDGYDFFEAFRKPFLPSSKQAPAQPDPAPSTR